MAWSAAQYTKFEDERTRPARDLLAQVTELPDGPAFDLGCGPGNSTELILNRFRDNPLTGIDSDEDMLSAARTRLPELRFEKADLASWVPPAESALFFANAVFQWLPEHIVLFERLILALAPGGTLAVQMPDNLDEPTHVLMEETAEESAFASAFADRAARRKSLPSPANYVERLTSQGRPDRCLAHRVLSPTRKCERHRRMGKGHGIAPLSRRAARRPSGRLPRRLCR